MAVTPNSFVTPQTPKKGLQQILPADTSSLKTVLTGGTNGTKVSSLMLSSSDTSARDVTIGISRSGTYYPIGTVTVPITAGQIAATPGINALAASVCPGLPVDNDGQPYLTLQASDTLDIKSLTTVTAAKAISALADGSDY
jgi:histidinol dehydrogenase